MIEGYSPLVQTLLGTGLTWALTALGAVGCVFIHPKQSRELSDKIISCSLSFSAGVMVAASFWSLLMPSLELCDDIMRPYLGDHLHYLPSIFGFVIGALFVYFVELYVPNNMDIFPMNEFDNKNSESLSLANNDREELSNTSQKSMDSLGSVHLRSKAKLTPQNSLSDKQGQPKRRTSLLQQKRLLMLIFAVTLHNFPEGAAVGIAFSDPNKTSKQFNSGRHLAIGIAVQNFPEGLVVSLPLRAAGFSISRSIWYGQLSGMVEPLAGLTALFACQLMRILQPIGLAFAAGTMIYVVFQDVIPEAHEINTKSQTPTTLFAILGFCVMMFLEVGLL